MNELFIILLLLGSKGSYRSFTAGEKRSGTYFVGEVGDGVIIPDVNGTAEVPGTQFRDEAFAIAGSRCAFYDEAWNELVNDAHSGALSVSVHPDGVVVFGGTTQANPVRRYDADMNVDLNFYTPASGTWGEAAGTIYTEDLFFSYDGLSLYVVINRTGPTPRKYIYKFNATTGAQDWVELMRWNSYAAAGDSSGNFYTTIEGTSGQPWNPPTNFTGIVVYDEDGTAFDWWDQGVGYNYDMWVDHALDMLISTGPSGLRISDLDGINFVTDTPNGGKGCITKGAYIYWCGVRRNTAVGFGSYIKSDTEGNVIAVYDPGGNLSGGYMILDHNDVVTGRGWLSSTPVGTEDETVYSFDDDMNLLASYALSSASLSDSTTAGGAATIPFITAGTPATAGTPGLTVTADRADGEPPARLLPFIASTGVARVIEAGAGYMRFYKDVP
jgi:hypothetical protein